jgi:hypothetical protein
MVDVARRLSEDNQIHVSEIWSYHAVGEEVRFTLVHRSRDPVPLARARGSARPAPAARRKGRGVKRPARRAKPASRSKARKTPARAQKRK